VRLQRVGITALVSGLALVGCGSAPDKPTFVTPPASGPAASSPSSLPSLAPTPTSSPSPSPSAPKARALPRPGNPAGHAAVPAAAKAVDTSKPDHVVGTGTPGGCTSAAVVKAVAAGGIITFNCGAAPVTITMTATAKVRNRSGGRVVLDGGGRVTLSGGGKRRILYQNTCDPAQGITTSHCQDQDSPRLTVQNLVFANGNSTGQTVEGGGGGAIFVRGGRFTVVNSRFVGNRCDRTGPDLGGAAIRVLSQSKGLPVYVVNSTFENGSCSNGAAFSSIAVSWIVLNSVLSHNSAVGRGANPARAGTPGGGSGGAIYLDGNRFTLTLDGTVIENNHAEEGGGAVFFVSNDRTGTMTIRNSRLIHNKSDGFETQGLPGIFFIGAARPSISGSTLKK
jgi:hypothetical protein